MARQFDMCDVCKLDKIHICDYKCIKGRSDFMLRYFTCPNFIYDNGQPITNAEWISTLLKTNIDLAVNELRYHIYFNNRTRRDALKEWLKQSAEINNTSK